MNASVDLTHGNQAHNSNQSRLLQGTVETIWKSALATAIIWVTTRFLNEVTAGEPFLPSSPVDGVSGTMYFVLSLFSLYLVIRVLSAWFNDSPRLLL